MVSFSELLTSHVVTAVILLDGTMAAWTLFGYELDCFLRSLDVASVDVVFGASHILVPNVTVNKAEFGSTTLTLEDRIRVGTTEVHLA